MSRSRRCSADRDRGALRLDQGIELRGIGGTQPDAAVRHRPAEVGDLIGAVDRIAAAKEDRMRHRRMVVFARIMHRLKAGRMIGAARRHIAWAGRRNRPDIGLAAGVNRHPLAGEIDMDVDRRLSTPRGDQKTTDHGQGSNRDTHGPPPASAHCDRNRTSTIDCAFAARVKRAFQVRLIVMLDSRRWFAWRPSARPPKIRHRRRRERRAVMV